MPPFYVTKNDMIQSIPEWATKNLWDTALKKFNVIQFVKTDHIVSNLLKAVFLTILFLITVFLFQRLQHSLCHREAKIIRVTYLVLHLHKKNLSQFLLFTSFFIASKHYEDKTAQNSVKIFSNQGHLLVEIIS